MHYPLIPKIIDLKFCVWEEKNAELQQNKWSFAKNHFASPK